MQEFELDVVCECGSSVSCGVGGGFKCASKREENEKKIFRLTNIYNQRVSHCIVDLARRFN